MWLGEDREHMYQTSLLVRWKLPPEAVQSMLKAVKQSKN